MECSPCHSPTSVCVNDGCPVTGPASGRFSVLDYEQVRRLDQVMEEVVPIHGRGNFPTLEVRLKQLVRVVRDRLARDAVKVRDIRINGSAASYVLSSKEGCPQGRASYKDLDVIFCVEMATARHYDKVKCAVLESLLDFLPRGANRHRISSCSLKEAYVRKMVKVTSEEGDRWSLISLSNNAGRNVELKFVDTMRRQFEFSVDSFQIVLDSLLLFDACAEMPMGENFYPTVMAESVYGDFAEALCHLQRRLIATRNPEEIRGGGLLKYCNLLTRGYQPADADAIKTLERYMCSRFFIDFSDVSQQQAKLENYLANHLTGDEHMLAYQYLLTLHKVVDESTVCLMGHERRQTLALIEDLACHVFYAEQRKYYAGNGGACKVNHCQSAVMYYYTPYMAASPAAAAAAAAAAAVAAASSGGAGAASVNRFAWMPCA